MSSEAYKNILSANLQRNVSYFSATNWEEVYYAARQWPKTANTTKDFIREKKWKVLDRPSRSPDLNPIENAFRLLKRNHPHPHPSLKGQAAGAKSLIILGKALDRMTKAI